jgi:hypothetical protein
LQIWLAKFQGPVVGRQLEVKLRFDFFSAAGPSPNFDPRDTLAGFETFSVAKERRQALCEILATGDSAACSLGRVIVGCRKGRRCRSAACPVCSRKFRIVWCGRLAQAIHTSFSDWVSVSLVPPDLRFLRGQLHNFHPNQFKDRLRKQLERGKLGISRATIIGGIDIALQVFEDPRRQPEWRPHAYLLIKDTSSGVIRNALDRHYPKSDDTPRPLRITPIKQAPLDAVKVATYSWKNTFSGRLPATDGLGNDDTAKESIPDDCWIELAPRLHDWDFEGRLIRRGSPSNFSLLKIR